MKSTQLITAALLALGVISTASASTSVTVNGTNYTEVFITGSTAFRANLFAALTTVGAPGNPTVFDSGTTPNALAPGNLVAASSSSGTYEVIGTIGGNPYIINVALTGSEAGLYALENGQPGAVAANVQYTVPTHTWMPAGSRPVNPVQLPGTLTPTYIDPTTAPVLTATLTGQIPDLSLADTSQAVSLSATLTPLTEYGIVGVVPFTWAKGYQSAPGSADASWKDLLNVNDGQLQNVLYVTEKASLLTGVASDTDNVYLIGRNKGSGTRVNTLLTLGASVSKAVVQYAVNDATYVSGNTLTAAGTAGTFTVNSIGENATGTHLIKVGNDGFDSGGGVKTTLNYNINGLTGFLTLGYLGISDALGLKNPTLASAGGAGQWLTYNGVAESDTNIYTGAYSFWGHEHLYGVPSQSSTGPGGTIAQLLAGTQSVTTPNTTISSAFTTTASALEANGNLSSAAAAPNNSSLDAALMHAEKSLGDGGYPQPF
jgi:hypothetical protein